MTPGSAVEDAGDRGEQDVAPVEVQGALVEVGEAEEAGSQQKCYGAADAALEEILRPAAEEELFGDGDEEEGEDIGCGEVGEAWPEWVNVQEAEAQAEYESDWYVEDTLAEADADVGQVEAEIEADAVQLADVEDAVDAGIEQKHLVEDGEVRGPGGFEPAQIDGEAEDEEDQEVAPVAGLAGIGLCGLMHEGGDCDGD